MGLISSKHTTTGRNLKAEQAMYRHIAAIERACINPDFAYQSGQLITEKINWLVSHCELVLDVGQSSRDHARLFLPGQLESVDISAGIGRY